MLQERVPSVVHCLNFKPLDPSVQEAVITVLKALKVPPDDIVENMVNGELSLNVYGKQKERLKSIQAAFKSLGLFSVVPSLTILRPKDWASRWKKNWRPARLTKKFDVVPLWCRGKYRKPKGRSAVWMDTLLSFGTGLHETTRIMAQFIEDQRGSYGSFCDIGTGTGILAIMACKYSASPVLAIDIGDLSVKAAKDNFNVNYVKARVVKADIEKIIPRRSYDMVAANLVTHDLIRLKKNIIRWVKPGGVLAVSGISLSNIDVFEKGFCHPGLLILKRVKGKEWAGYLFLKKM